ELIDDTASRIDTLLPAVTYLMSKRYIVMSRVIVDRATLTDLAKTPLLSRGGEDATSIKISRSLLMERTGWCWSRKCLVVDQHHPGCAGLGGFAAFFLIRAATPPRLRRGS